MPPAVHEVSAPKDAEPKTLAVIEPSASKVAETKKNKKKKKEKKANKEKTDDTKEDTPEESVPKVTSAAITQAPQGDAPVEVSGGGSSEQAEAGQVPPQSLQDQSSFPLALSSSFGENQEQKGSSEFAKENHDSSMAAEQAQKELERLTLEDPKPLQAGPEAPLAAPARACAKKALAKPPVKHEAPPTPSAVTPCLQGKLSLEVKRTLSDNLHRATSSIQQTPSCCPPVKPDGDDLPSRENDEGEVEDTEGEEEEEEEEEVQDELGKLSEGEVASKTHDLEIEKDRSAKGSEPAEKAAAPAEEKPKEKPKRREKTPAEKAAHARYMRFSRSFSSHSIAHVQN